MERNNSSKDSADIERIRQILARALGLKPDELPVDIRQGAHPRWDSLGHMHVVMDLEKEFGVRFPSYDLAELTSIDNILQAINRIRGKTR